MNRAPGRYEINAKLDTCVSRVSRIKGEEVATLKCTKRKQ